MMAWDDVQVVIDGKGRACVICGGLVTPAHRYCGWHEWKRKMNPPPWDWLVQDFMRFHKLREVTHEHIHAGQDDLCDKCGVPRDCVCHRGHLSSLIIDEAGPAT